MALLKAECCAHMYAYRCYGQQYKRRLLLCIHAHKHTHTHTHTHAYTHTCTHTHMHARTCTHTHTLQTYMHKHKHTHSCTDAHAQIHMHPPTYTAVTSIPSTHHYIPTQPDATLCLLPTPQSVAPEQTWSSSLTHPLLWAPSTLTASRPTPKCSCATLSLIHI